MAVWRLYLLFCAILLSIASSEHVLTLDQYNFEDLTKHGDWLLEFYAPWCTHCKKLAPILEEAAAQIHSTSEFRVGKIDCTTEKALAKKFNIKGYPTLKIWRDGEAKSYRGDRSVEGVVEYVGKLTKPSILRGGQQLVKAMLEEFYVVFAFFGDSQTNHFNAFVKASRSHQGMLGFAQILDVENARELGMDTTRGPVLQWHTRDGDVETLYLNEAQTVDPLRNFVDSHQFAIVQELHEINYEDVVKSSNGKKTFIAVVDPSSVHTPGFLREVRQVALQDYYRNLYNFASIDGNKWSTYLNNFEITADQLPTAFVFDSPEEVYWLPRSAPRSVAQLSSFIDEVVTGSISPRGKTMWSFGGIMNRIDRYLEGLSEVAVIGFIVAGTVVFLAMLFCAFRAIDSSVADANAQHQLAGQQSDDQGSEAPVHERVTSGEAEPVQRRPKAKTDGARSSHPPTQLEGDSSKTD